MSSPEHSPEHSPAHSDTENVPKERKGKGVVLMRELTALRDAGIKLEVKFDDLGEAIEKIGDKYKSYIGVLARTKVPIDICSWKHVGAELKEKIWDDVLTIFDIPLSKKKQVITIANNRWTNFKSKLTSLYVYKKPSEKRKRPCDGDPLKKYDYITPEVWKRFKAIRMTKEFQASSELAAERQKKNKYPHRMSRGGYRKIRLKLEKKSLEAKKSGKSVPKIRRGDLWIEGRVNKKKECLNSETDAAIERISLVNEQVVNGEFLPSGKVDVLTKALGTDEHYGRVRGVGGVVGHKQYFGKCTHRRKEGVSKEYLEMLTQMITEKVTANMKKEMEFIVEQRITGALEKNNKNGNSFSVEYDHVENDCINDAEAVTNCKSGNASYAHDQPDPFDEIPEKGAQCQLDVIDTKLINVALGRVFRSPTQASRSHGQAFGENEVRVSIEVVLEGKEDVELPVPTKELSTIGDAMGSFVRWPKNLITFGHPESNHEVSRERQKKYKSGKQKKFDVMASKEGDSDKSKTKESVVRSNSTLKTLLNKKHDSRKLMSKVVSMIDVRQSSSLPLSENVVGYKQTIFLSKDDMTQLLNMEKLSISCIQAFIGYLDSICDNDRYGFICPQISSLVGHSADEAATYISTWLDKGKKKIYLVPYHHEGHWMLAIIDIIENNKVYWCDPVGNSEIPIFRTLINTSIRVYGYEGGSRKSSKVPQWIKLDCARQPGITECGYYIMRYMLEIITSAHSMHSLDELFQDTSPYSLDEIDEVRDLWADHFLNA